MSDNTYDVRCNCGEVEVQLAGDPAACVYCHCPSCRNARERVFYDIVAWKPDQLTVTKGEGSIIDHAFTDKMSLKSCGKCGSAVYNTNGLGLVVTSQHQYMKANGGKLPDALKAQIHIFYADRVVDVADDLPKFKDLPEPFGGSGELVS
jgi:hypothetical protein